MIKKSIHLVSSLFFLASIIQLDAMDLDAMDQRAGIALAAGNPNKIDDDMANAFGARRGKVEDSFMSEASDAAKDDTPLESFRLILKEQFSRDDKSETVFFLVGFLQAISRKLNDALAVTKIMEIGDTFREQLKRGLFNDVEKIQLNDILKGKKQLVEASPSLQNLSAALQADDAILREIALEKEEALKAEQEKAAQAAARNARAGLFSAINQNGAKTLKSSPGKKRDGTFIEPQVHRTAEIEEKPKDQFGASRFIPKGQPESSDEPSSLEGSWLLSSYEQRRDQAAIARALASSNRLNEKEETDAMKAEVAEAERKARADAEALKKQKEQEAAQAEAKRAEQALSAAQPKTPDNSLSGKNAVTAPKPASRVDTPAPKKVVVNAKNGQQPTGLAPKAPQGTVPSRPLPAGPNVAAIAQVTDQKEQDRLEAEARRIRLQETEKKDTEELARIRNLGGREFMSPAREKEVYQMLDREYLRKKAAEEEATQQEPTDPKKEPKVEDPEERRKREEEEQRLMDEIMGQMNAPAGNSYILRDEAAALMAQEAVKLQEDQERERKIAEEHARVKEAEAKAKQEAEEARIAAEQEKARFEAARAETARKQRVLLLARLKEQQDRERAEQEELAKREREEAERRQAAALEATRLARENAERLQREQEEARIAQAQQQEQARLERLRLEQETAARLARENDEREQRAREEARIASEEQQERARLERLRLEREALHQVARENAEQERLRLEQEAARQAALIASEARARATQVERDRIFRENNQDPKKQRSWLYTVRDLTGITAILGGSAWLYNKYVKKPETEEELKKKRAAQRAKMQEKNLQPQAQAA